MNTIMAKSEKHAKTPAVEAEKKTLTTTNGVGMLLAVLLNQEGWTKSVEEIILAGDLLNGVLPEDKPKDDADWDDREFVFELTSKQLKTVKNCLNAIADKGSLLPSKVVFNMISLLEYPIPDTKETFTLKLPQVAAKYLGDIISTPEKTKGVQDLITASMVVTKIPKFDNTLTEKGSENALKYWMEDPVEIELTERQRDFCRSCLKKAAEDGRVKTSKYTPILYTELGLRE